jgi:hypothetical protein
MLRIETPETAAPAAAERERERTLRKCVHSFGHDGGRDGCSHDIIERKTKAFAGSKKYRKQTVPYNSNASSNSISNYNPNLNTFNSANYTGYNYHRHGIYGIAIARPVTPSQPGLGAKLAGEGHSRSAVTTSSARNPFFDVQPKPDRAYSKPRI